MNADLSTISPQSDRLYLVSEPAGGNIHLEMQAGHHTELPARLHLYNTLAQYHHGAPVRTVLLLLRRQADSPALTGLDTATDERGEYLRFRYTVVRLWELPCEQLLTGPIGLIPLALLTDDAGPRLPELLARANQRFQAEAPPGGHGELLSACNILLGLRYDRTVIEPLFQRLRTMRESSTYMAILEEGEKIGEQRGEKRGMKKGEKRGKQQGELFGLREAIAALVADRFGPPPHELDAIADRDRLRRLVRQAIHARDWAELLATP